MSDVGRERRSSCSSTSTATSTSIAAAAVSLEDVKESLKHFETKVDLKDPVQVKMLEEMREHTRALLKAKGMDQGGWSKPSTFRNWNNYGKEGGHQQLKVKKPLDYKEYRDYKEYSNNKKK